MASLKEIPFGLCHCGCGEKTKLSPRTRLSKGTIKGQPYRFIAGHQTRIPEPGYLIDPKSGCWIWLSVPNKHGYGYLERGGKSFSAHRFVYEKIKGAIPTGYQLDHLCRNRICVNPDHLEPVTQQENIRRGNTGINMSSKTHCPKGHTYDDKNTRIGTRGERRCRACLRQWDKERRPRKSLAASNSI